MHTSVFVFALALLFGNWASAHTAPPVSLPRDEALSRLLVPVKGAGPVVPVITQLQATLKANPTDQKNIERLGRCFITQARIVSDESLCTKAEICGQLLESIDAKNPAGLLLRGHCLLAMHQFHDAEDVGRKLLTLRQEMQDHALLGDALMEQGHLEEAQVAYQAMIDAKPCLPSYSRVAHFRWLKGDVIGAIEMAEQAIACGSYRDPEPLAWVTTRLAFYQWQNGAMETAEQTAGRALELVQGYPHALFVQGRVFLAQGDAAKAVDCLKLAAVRLALPEIQWALADALEMNGQRDEAGKVISAINEATDPRSFALHSATRRMHVEKALDLAKTELRSRRDVFSWDALAWAQYAAGETSAAMISTRKALAEGTRDARLSLHAGIIARAAGEAELAAKHIGAAKAMRLQLLPSEQALLDLTLTASN